jgi:asparaginyl-tRNA synthetase
MRGVRLKIKHLLAEGKSAEDIFVQGWIRTRRGSKKINFIELNDGSTVKNLQVIAEQNLENFEEIRKLSTGAAIGVQGNLVQSPGSGQSVELQATKITIYGPAPAETYPLQKKGHTLEFLRQIAHLRPRTNTFSCVFRLRNTLAWAIHRFFQERGFVYVHTPIITTSDCEGAGEMFQVTTLPFEKGEVDFQMDFFGRPAFLTVSGQLEAELFALGLGDVYTFGPTFRAENSNTPRHLAEFWMVEPEMAFADLEEDMHLAEVFLKSILSDCLEHSADDLAFLQEHYQDDLIPVLEHVCRSEFVRVPYTEAVDILNKSGESFEYPTEWGNDLQTEHERYLTEKHFKKPVVVYDYPKTIKAFYMRLNEDGRTVAAMDVLFPRIGEIIGGSQREEREEVLLGRIQEMNLPEENYQWYLDTRRFGTAPHSGFGLGFERCLQFCSGMANIRDVIPFPRTPGSAEF